MQSSDDSSETGSGSSCKLLTIIVGAVAVVIVIVVVVIIFACKGEDKDEKVTPVPAGAPGVADDLPEDPTWGDYVLHVLDHQRGRSCVSSFVQ